MTAADERRFHFLYLAWLQCGAGTDTLDEDRERAFRQRGPVRKPDTCVHGKTPLTCEWCYLQRGNSL